MRVEKRGGKREGAGRKPKPLADKVQNKTIGMYKADWRIFDRLRSRMSRGRFLSAIVKDLLNCDQPKGKL